MQRRTLTRLMLMLAFLPLTACGGEKPSPPGAPLEGRILESGTRHPIPGAIVIVRWQGFYSQFVDTQDVCYHVETASTDGEGRWRTPAWRPEDLGPNFRPAHYLIEVYKAGYERDWPPGFDRSEEFRQNVYFMKRFKGTRGERFQYLQRLEQSIRVCRSPEADEKNLLPFYRALHGEGGSIARAPNEWEIVDGFLTDIDVIDLGYKEGMKRGIERAEKRRRQP